ncbi:hypothetical protein CBR_g26449 [Chara braunii]|uniref:Reverse transcriptase domain-containing protein n=1 Tax=Chara braunii TaxID=69332 RepID=A0A388L7X2_CHABU|nr:hypothetical protein CBR_g26449 [Chara braunii]|eukprot:GBG78421.1 hypothetical protein CBR_g26449 [Chara braunii]
MGRSKKSSRGQVLAGNPATSGTAVNSPSSQCSTALLAWNGPQQMVPGAGMQRPAPSMSTWAKGSVAGVGGVDGESSSDRDWPSFGGGKLSAGGPQGRGPVSYEGGSVNTPGWPGNCPASCIKGDMRTQAPWHGSDRGPPPANCMVPVGATDSGAVRSRSNSEAEGHGVGPSHGPWNSAALKGSWGSGQIEAASGGGYGSREFQLDQTKESSWGPGRSGNDQLWSVASPRTGDTALFIPGSVRPSIIAGARNKLCSGSHDDEAEDEDNELEASDVDIDEDDEWEITEDEHRCYEKKFYGGFMESLRKMDTDRFDSSSCEGCCPVCKTVDHFVKLSSFEQHAKTKKSRRRAHQAFAIAIARLREARAKEGSSSKLSSAAQIWRSLEASADVQIVWPPWVIVQNTRKDKDASGKWVGMGSNELRPLFKQYVIEKEKHSYGPDGHRGMSALEFESTPAGYLAALDLDEHFRNEGKGRKEWESARRVLSGSVNNDGSQKNLFGYLATEKDITEFNRHCSGKKNQRAIKYNMVSRREMVIEPQRCKDEESRNIDELKSRAMIAQETAYSLERQKKEAERQKKEAEQRYSQATEELNTQRDWFRGQEEVHRSKMEALRRFHEEKLKHAQEAQEQKVRELLKRQQKAVKRDENEIEQLIQSRNLTEEQSSKLSGEVLVQKEGKKLRPVEYMSKKMPSKKLAKSTYERELYALSTAPVHWRHYLLGRFFYLRTDHQTLKWIKTHPVLSDALKRWIEVVDQYDFKLDYVKGEYNKVADARSRGKVVSKIDLKSGYHQIEVDPADQHKTAFKTHDGLYEFNVMPFSLTNALAIFQSLMDNVFRSLINRFVAVYLGDILVFSKSMEKDMRHLEEVLQILKDAQLREI